MSTDLLLLAQQSQSAAKLVSSSHCRSTLQAAAGGLSRKFRKE